MKKLLVLLMASLLAIPAQAKPNRKYLVLTGLSMLVGSAIASHQSKIAGRQHNEQSTRTETYPIYELRWDDDFVRRPHVVGYGNRTVIDQTVESARRQRSHNLHVLSVALAMYGTTLLCGVAIDAHRDKVVLKKELRF